MLSFSLTPFFVRVQNRRVLRRPYKNATCSFCGVAGVGAYKKWVHVHPKGEKAPSVFSSCIFASKGDERNAEVPLAPKIASYARICASPAFRYARCEASLGANTLPVQ